MSDDLDVNGEWLVAFDVESQSNPAELPPVKSVGRIW